MVARFLITSSKLPSVRISQRHVSTSTPQGKDSLPSFLKRTHRFRPSFRQ